MKGTLADLIARMDAKILGTPQAAEGSRSDARESEMQTRVRALRLPLVVRDFLLSGVDEHGQEWIDSEPYRKAAAWVAQRKRIIVLSGIPGAGKTCAACRVLAEQISGAFVSSAAYCEQASKRKASGYWQSSTLVLDDLGVEAVGAAYEIDKLLLERHAAKRITLITTTLSGDSFEKRYSAATLSRLREVGRWVVCTELLRKQ